MGILLLWFVWTFVVFWLGIFVHWLATIGQRRELKHLRKQLDQARNVINRL